MRSITVLNCCSPCTIRFLSEINSDKSLLFQVQVKADASRNPTNHPYLVILGCLSIKSCTLRFWQLGMGFEGSFKNAIATRQNRAKTDMGHATVFYESLL